MKRGQKRDAIRTFCWEDDFSACLGCFTSASLTVFWSWSWFTVASLLCLAKLA